MSQWREQGVFPEDALIGALHTGARRPVAQGLVVAAERAVHPLGVQAEEGLPPRPRKVLRPGQHLPAQAGMAGGRGQVVDVESPAVVSVGPPGVPLQQGHHAHKAAGVLGGIEKALPDQLEEVAGGVVIQIAGLVPLVEVLLVHPGDPPAEQVHDGGHVGLAGGDDLRGLVLRKGETDWFHRHVGLLICGAALPPPGGVCRFCTGRAGENLFLPNRPEAALPGPDPGSLLYAQK